MKKKRTNEIRMFTLDAIAREAPNVANLVTKEFGISRQAANRHLASMLNEGILTAKGATRNREYSLKPFVSKRFEFDLADELLRDSMHGFTKTKVPVALARYGDESLISRSQAKRLLARFERFKEVILDFSNVESVGPAFADEIFRVFTQQHPSLALRYVNANEEVRKMILRAQSQQ